jgi:hypothetical protein
MHWDEKYKILIYREDNIKMNFTDTGCGLERSGSGYVPVAL